MRRKLVFAFLLYFFSRTRASEWPNPQQEQLWRALQGERAEEDEEEQQEKKQEISERELTPNDRKAK